MPKGGAVSHRAVVCILGAFLLLLSGAKLAVSPSHHRKYFWHRDGLERRGHRGREYPGEEYRDRRHTDHDLQLSGAL